MEDFDYHEDDPITKLEAEILAIEDVIGELQTSIKYVNSTTRTIIQNEIDKLETLKSVHKYRVSNPEPRGYHLRKLYSTLNGESINHVLQQMSAYYISSPQNLSDYETEIELACIRADKEMHPVVVEGEGDKLLIIRPNGKVSVAVIQSHNHLLVREQDCNYQDALYFITSYTMNGSTFFDKSSQEISDAIADAVKYIRKGYTDVVMWRCSEGKREAIEHPEISKVRAESGYYSRNNKPENPIGKIIGTTSKYPGQFSVRFEHTSILPEGSPQPSKLGVVFPEEDYEVFAPKVSVILSAYDIYDEEDRGAVVESFTDLIMAYRNLSSEDIESILIGLRPLEHEWAKAIVGELSYLFNNFNVDEVRDMLTSDNVLSILSRVDPLDKLSRHTSKLIPMFGALSRSGDILTGFTNIESCLNLLPLQATLTVLSVVLPA